MIAVMMREPDRDDDPALRRPVVELAIERLLLVREGRGRIHEHQLAVADHVAARVRGRRERGRAHGK
jgi:hypothetical protein